MTSANPTIVLKKNLTREQDGIAFLFPYCKASIQKIKSLPLRKSSKTYPFWSIAYEKVSYCIGVYLCDGGIGPLDNLMKKSEGMR